MALNFDFYKCTLYKLYANQLIFEIRLYGVSQKFEFQANNQQDYDIWTYTIEAAIKDSEG